jgi:hypothetical protein
MCARTEFHAGLVGRSAMSHSEVPKASRDPKWKVYERAAAEWRDAPFGKLLTLPTDGTPPCGGPATKRCWPSLLASAAQSRNRPHKRETERLVLIGTAGCYPIGNLNALL